MPLPQSLRAFAHELAAFPWRSTAHTLRERFQADRLGLTASSLTFTTTIALVPLFTVALALFTAFPVFAKFQDVLQTWLIDSLIPDSIPRQAKSHHSEGDDRSAASRQSVSSTLRIIPLSISTP